MIWIIKVPLPPAYLSPNNPTGSIGVRHAKADAEAKYKEECVKHFLLCPAKQALFVRVSAVWHCCNDPSLKAQPNKKGVKTKASIMRQPYYPRDFGNAWGASKYLLDAIVEAGIVPTDSWRHMAGGTCDVWPTDVCRKAGIHTPGVLVTLDINEDLKLI